MTAVKIIRVMGTSDESWEDAAREAHRAAEQSVDNISGMKVHDQSVDVDNSEVGPFKTTMEVSFRVEESQNQ